MTNLFKILFLFILFLSFSFWAQPDKGKKSISFPRLESNLEVKPKQNLPSFSVKDPFIPKLFKTAPKTYEAPKLDKTISMKEPQSDLDPGKEYEDKLNSKSSEGAMHFSLYRKNEFFGEFKSESAFVGIACRDHGNVDGDQIKVWLNGVLVVEFVQLSGGFQQLNIALVQGFNKIEIEAINEGIYVPNTAEFVVTDEKGILINNNKWNLGAGFKASFVVVKP